MAERSTHAETGPATVDVCVVGSGTHFLSGISYFTDRLGSALSAHWRVSVVLMRSLVPRLLYPGRVRVGRDLVKFDYGGCEVFDGVDWWSIPSALLARRALNRWRPRVVVFEWWTGAVLHNYILLALKAKSLGSSVVLEFHEVLDTAEARIPFSRAYVRVLSRWLMRLVDGFVVHSSEDVPIVEARYALRGRPSAIVPHPPYDRYDPPQRRASAGNGDRADRPLTLLFFGVLRPYKGVDYLLRAFDSLSEEDASQFRLLIVGETWENWHLPASLIEQNRHRERIEFVNRYVHDDEAREFFNRANAVVLPYTRSSSSGPLAIAMSLGLPVVTTRVGGIPEAVAGYEGAVLVPPEDPEAIRRALLALPRFRGQRFKPAYSWATAAERYEEFFRKLEKVKAA